MLQRHAVLLQNGAQRDALVVGRREKADVIPLPEQVSHLVEQHRNVVAKSCDMALRGLDEALGGKFIASVGQRLQKDDLPVPERTPEGAGGESKLRKLPRELPLLHRPLDFLVQKGL